MPLVNIILSRHIELITILRTWSHLLKKSLMENFFFCAVLDEPPKMKNSPSKKKDNLDILDIEYVVISCLKSREKISSQSL